MDLTTKRNAASPDPDFAPISSVLRLRQMLDSLKSAARIAVDTEGDSLYHYYEKVCLVQISSDSDTYVIDPLVLKDLSPLGPVLADPGVEKVFHAASYDLLCLRRDYGFSFSNIFDTHLAAQFLGHSRLGLGALLENFLGVVHSKRRQRDDWSRRPLNPEQLEYAAMDTRHLLALRDLLAEQLRERGRLSWAAEEFEAAAKADNVKGGFDPDGFRRIKGSSGLTLRELAVLRRLYLLRERVAMEADLPPFKVLHNSVLIDLARKPPQRPEDLRSRSGISHRVATRHARQILQAIEGARTEDPASLKPLPQPRWTPLSDRAKERLERLKEWRRKKADALGLSVGILFPGQLLEQLAQSDPGDVATLERTDGIRRWRVREFGEEILRLLNG